ncbi:OB-fold domain-containing protein [Paraburkholderia sediminicola]|uniref:Zn-ribbon domain-containing OB-fold protein n=1 Tax=Paraburkholderia sediminicola TaxID=458836 RepID=UPI0038BA4D44
MQSNSTQFASSGAAYTDDALPLADLASAETATPFEIVYGRVMLRGSTSRSSGSKAFPAREVCMETGARDMEPALFGPRGTLYSYTTVHVSSSRPTPYTIGYVDFREGVRVLAHIEIPAGTTAELNCDTMVELRAVGERWFVVPVITDAE